ncbi:MAG: hypothetical protein WD045_16375 [Pirellulaceae bacterium]
MIFTTACASHKDKVGGDFPYHYLGSAIWFNRIGGAMADAMIELMQDKP